MKQETLLKWMLAASILFSAVSMTVMLYFSATKTIVIAEETAPEQAQEERVSGEREKERLHFQAGGKETELRIPLPAEIRADNIVIENRYLEHSLNIILTGKYREFYTGHALLGSDTRVTGGFVCEEGETTRLQILLSGPYEHQYIFENGTLALTFARPSELYDKIVVLDAAGGGSETGRMGCGLAEKDIALKITELIMKKLADTDIRVYCTRTDDVDVSAQERSGFVKDMEADLLVGIRAGADENDADRCGIQSFYNADYVIPEFGNAELADLLERGAVKAGKGRANGLYEAPDTDILLRNAQIPAAAIELGYLTNEEEAALLSSSAYQDKLAEGIADALKEAFARKRPHT